MDHSAAESDVKEHEKKSNGNWASPSSLHPTPQAINPKPEALCSKP